MSRCDTRFTALLLIAVLATAARAEHDWSGPYVGVNGGHGWGQASTEFAGDGDADGLFGTGTGTAGEANDGNYTQQFYRDVYGLYFGYNVRVWKGFVAGFEAAYNLTNMNVESKNALVSSNWTGTTIAADLRIMSLFSLAPQVAYGWGPALFRMKGGISGGRVASHLWTDQNNGGNLNPTEFGQDQTQLGWMIGGGIDFALTDHWIAGVAFDYYDIGKLHFGGLAVPDTNWPLAYEVHPVLRTGTFRLAYKFGSGSVEPKARKTPAPEPAVSNDPHAALIAALSSKDETTRAEAAVALGDLRVMDAVDPLIAALNDKSIPVRGAAADALGKIGSEKALNPLVALLQDKQPEVRALAARALGVLGDSEALPALRKLAAHETDPKVRRVIAAAVKQLSRP